MKQIELRTGKKALAIVAHPDDETIWMGGTILKHPRLDWTIFCLTRASDADREPKFRRICDIYGAKSIISDLEDEGKLGLAESIPLIKRIIAKEVGNNRYDYIFTHGQNGEYGHPRHKGVHRAVRELVEGQKLRCKTLFCFNYKKAEAGKRPSMEAKKDTDAELVLEKEVFLKKKKLQSEVHGYPYNGIDNSLCTNPEAFKIYNI